MVAPSGRQSPGRLRNVVRVTKLHRIVSVFLLASMISAIAAPVHAQSPAPPPPPQSTAPPAPQSGDTVASGLFDGETMGEGLHTGGKFAGGLALGVLTGFIGTGIGYFVIGPESLTGEALLRNQGRGPDYQLGFKTGWDKKTKSKKRNAFLAGGLIGTAAWVTIIAVANSVNGR